MKNEKNVVDKKQMEMFPKEKNQKRKGEKVNGSNKKN